MDSREVEMEEAEEEVSHDPEEVIPGDPVEEVPLDQDKEVPRDPEKEVPSNVLDGHENLEESQVDTNMESEKGDSPGQMVEDEQNLIETGMDETKSVGEGSDKQNSEYESEDSGSPNQNASEEEKVTGNAEDTSPNENGQQHSELPPDEPPECLKEGLSDGPSEPVEKDAAVAVAQDNRDGAVAPNEMLKSEAISTSTVKQHEPSTPVSPVKYSLAKAKTLNVETPKSAFDDIKMAEGDEVGTPEDQAAFMREIESFYRERSLEFKPPKFYGQPLNCLKLWRAVIRLGGYDRVTGSKLWRQVGESFHPPKTCTTVSWTFRIFYEKALLEYERHKVQSGEIELPIAPLPEPSSAENEVIL